ncbi:MAG: PAS domain S-box protein [Chitinophagaceae bacterium]|nr:PAS domain S-box protein [Chitinophagaceae bacterium]
MHKQLKHITARLGRRSVLLFVLFSSMLLLAVTIAQISRAGIHTANTESIRAYFLAIASGNVLLIGTAMFLITCVFYLLLMENRRQRRIIGKLRMQEEHLRVIISNIGEGLIATDRKGGIIYMNPAAEKLTGWSRGEAKNLPLEKVYQVVNEETGKPFENIVSRIFKHGLTVQPENNTLLHTKNKNTLVISNSGSPLMDRKGNISGAVVLFNNITEQKKRDDELKQSEEKYRMLIEQASDGVLIYSFDGTIYEFNEAAYKQIGYSKEEFATLKLPDLFFNEPVILNQAVADKIFAGQTVLFNRRVKKKDGTAMEVEINARMLPDGRSLAFVRDITERKRTEQAMQMALERYDILSKATSDTIWDWDIIHNRMHYNEGISKMFGHQITETGNIADWWKENIHPDDIKNVTDALEKAFKKERQNLQLEYRFRCDNGTYKYIYDRAFVIFDEQENPVRIIGAMQDITYQKEEELRIARAIADAQEQERRHIGEELHDNVNQILVGSLLTLGMAKDKNTDREKVNSLIDASKNHVLNAIEELRKLSHEIAPATFEKKSLRDIFETLLEGINPNKQFNINFEFDEAVNTINDDIQLNLYRILQGQVKDILNYSGANALEVKLTCSENSVKMRIFDNGRGFDTRKPRRGIGLNNIKNRAESFGGKFILNSAPGMGCEIVVEIPVEAEPGLQLVFK